MPLERFFLENYRCFKSRQEVELGKITVVLGRNNSGKSAVVRALPILATGIHADSSYPLDIDPDNGFAGSFMDLVHGASPHGHVKVGASFHATGGKNLGIAAKIQNITEHSTQLVSELELSSDSESEIFTWVRRPDTYTPGKRTYQVGDTKKKLSFRGLMPAASDWSDTVGGVDGFSGEIRESFDQIRYLGPFRKSPDRFFRISGKVDDSVGSKGEKALGILAVDKMRGRGLITHEVNHLLAEVLPGWSLDIKDLGHGMYVPRLYSTRDPELFVHIDDVGTGVVQFLPMLIQRAADRVTPPSRPVIEIVEEPELHLHPSAHASIADMHIKAARESNVRFLVETHSENFLLRLRRRVAERRLPPEDLKIYFVEQEDGHSFLRKITVDELGNIDYWPTGIFSEDFEEVRALANAQANRGVDAG